MKAVRIVMADRTVACPVEQLRVVRGQVVIWGNSSNPEFVPAANVLHTEVFEVL